MDRARITFSNNETMVIDEGEIFIPIAKVDREGETSSAMQKTFEVFGHHHDGLIPSLTELFYRCQYFYHIDDPRTVYSTSAIVKLEII